MLSDLRRKGSDLGSEVRQELIPVGFGYRTRTGTGTRESPYGV